MTLLKAPFNSKITFLKAPSQFQNWNNNIGKSPWYENECAHMRIKSAKLPSDSESINQTWKIQACSDQLLCEKITGKIISNFYIKYWKNRPLIQNFISKWQYPKFCPQYLCSWLKQSLLNNTTSIRVECVQFCRNVYV